MLNKLPFSPFTVLLKWNFQWTHFLPTTFLFKKSNKRTILGREKKNTTWEIHTKWMKIKSNNNKIISKSYFFLFYITSMHIVIHMILSFFLCFVGRDELVNSFFFSLVVVVHSNQVLLLYWCENHRNVIFCSYFLYWFSLNIYL